MVKALILALVALAFSCDLSAAQNTRTGLDAYINSTFTANGKNAISGPQINTVLNAMTTSSGFLGDTNRWTGSNTFTGPFTMPGGSAATNLGFTPLAPANNLSDLASASSARSALGLAALATQSTVSLTSQATGALQAAQFPALTGDVTSSAGSLATTISSGAVTAAKMASGAAAGNLGFTPVKVINPADPAYGLSTSGTAAANATALQAAATAACAGGGNSYAIISVPAGFYNVYTGNGTVLPIGCSAVSFEASGSSSTTFNLSGAGDFIVYSPPSGQKYGGFASVKGFRTFRADSPTAGRGVFLDHTSHIDMSDVEITGSFIDVECNTCINFSFLQSYADGFQTQSGSKAFWIHHTVAYPVTNGVSGGAGTFVIPVTSTADVYVGQAVSGDASIPGGATVASWVANTSITLDASHALTGTVGSGETLTLADGNPSAVTITGGSLVAGNQTVAPWSYDNALLIQDCDGCWIGDAHIAWSRNASLTVQPQYSLDQIDNIITASNSYFDKSGGGCVDFEGYGATKTTTSAPTVSTNTTLTLSVAAPSNANGWTIIADGVPTGTTVGSGQGTTSIAMSAGANTLGVASGATVVLYPAYTGFDKGHRINGMCQGSVVDGVSLFDPSLTLLQSNIQILSAKGNGINVFAGRMVDFSGAMFSGVNGANVATNAPILVHGSASFIKAGGMFDFAANQTNYIFDVEGQADHVQMTNSMTYEVPALGVMNNGGLGVHVMGDPTGDFLATGAASGVPSLWTAAGGNNMQVYGANNFPIAKFVGTTGVVSSTNFPVFQSTGGVNWGVYGGAGATSIGNFNGSFTAAATSSIGSSFGDTVNIGKSGVVKAMNVYNYPYSLAGTPTIAANACGSTTQGTLAGTDIDGVVTVGTAGVTSCVINFSATLPNTPRGVTITPANATAAAWGTTGAYATIVSASQWKIWGTALAGALYNYHVE